jgi:hypothetical protein
MEYEDFSTLAVFHVEYNLKTWNVGIQFPFFMLHVDNENCLYYQKENRFMSHIFGNRVLRID